MNRRFIILAASGALILAVIGGLLFLAVKAQNQSKQPVVTVPQIKKIVSDRVISPIPADTDKGIWYFNSEGRLFRVNLDGTGLTEYPLPQLGKPILRVLWPQSGQDFIAISAGGTSEVKSYYNSKQNLYVNLPGNIKSLDWLPDSHRIAYIWQSGDSQTQQLTIANSDGTGFIPVKSVFWPDLQIKVSPSGKTALLYRSVIDGNINKIYSINLDSGEISTVVEMGKNFDVRWISANRFLFAQASITSYPRIYLYDLTTKQATDLDLNTNLDKLTADQTGQVVYAAIPNKDGSGDSFVTEDLTNFRKNDYFVPTEHIFAKGLMFIGDSLYFISTADGGIYLINK